MKKNTREDVCQGTDIFFSIYGSFKTTNEKKVRKRKKIKENKRKAIKYIEIEQKGILLKKRK